jgi:single-strand DNA-binding protein
MASLNRVLLMGNLTRDPELRQTPSGTQVCEFGLAMNRQWRGQDGSKQEEVTFVDITAFAKTAELVSSYLSKGRRVFVEGRLKYDQWTSPEGQKRSKLSVVAENVTFLDSRQDGQGSGGGGGAPSGEFNQGGGGGGGGYRQGGGNGGGGGGRGGYGQRPPQQQQRPQDDFGGDPPPDDIPF